MTDHSVSDVLLFTQDMLLLVIEEQWDQLMEMQVQQDKMLRQLFAAADPMFSKQEKEDLLEVQRLNQEVLKAAEVYRTDIAAELRSMRQGQAKASAYQSL